MITRSKDVLRVLETLAHAYPRQEVPQASLELYITMLEDIPIDLLWQAVDQHIAESIYFPRVSELRLQAARLAGTASFRSLRPNPRFFPSAVEGPDTLACTAQTLEDAFYQDRTLSPQAWLDLAEAFDRTDRPHRAEYTRRKLAGLQAVLEQEATALKQVVPE